MAILPSRFGNLEIAIRAGGMNNFMEWLSGSKKEPYHSFGNGSAMRVSPVGWAFESPEEVIASAYQSAMITHDYPEGIKGAQSVALAILMARRKKSKTEMRQEVMRRFGYDLNRSLAEIRSNYTFDVTCQGSVPEAIIAFLEAEDFEGALRNAISLGGDADTQAAIASSIAEAYYDGVPEEIISFVKKVIPEEFWIIVKEFNEKYIHQNL
jgi:ADP-ribosylglycohydrolase